ncbi:lasso peptide biosynthesis protein [Klebsiella quasipneumoniae]|jgi:hypothetical protein|uniref:lasso peptide biosynthesis protein n=1 Tax=Klebsiella quasipneumoniae TaxID=1463165 RepID=UPI001B0BD1F7|nr:hypothetical protein [Escherichia coli]HBV1486484.1 lasso peptide biosynthesis protein [Escherichia coli]
MLRIYSPFDSELGKRYVTSPKTGDTYAIDVNKKNAILRFLLYFCGVKDVINSTIDPLIRAYEPNNISICGDITPSISNMIQDEWFKIDDLIKKESIFNIISKISKADAVEEGVDFYDAIYIAHNFRKKSKTNCLQHSIWQSSILKKLGVSSKLYIGIWMPTDLAHAWVMVEDQVENDMSILVGDDADKVMHFAPTLEFSI